MISFVKDIALLAGHELSSRFRNKDLKLEYKADASIVTEADLASEKVIVDALRQRFPNDKICSEEGANQSLRGLYPPGTRIWIIDPLDGTSNFSHGLSYYNVSIGAATVLQNHELNFELGVVYAPCSNDMYYAEKGMGAFKNGQKLLPLNEKIRDLEKSFLVTGFYYDKEHLDIDVARFKAVAKRCQGIRRMGAAALDLCLTAEGIFDGYWERGLKAWDFAAGVLIVTEAQGRVVNYGAQDFSAFGEGILAGRPHTVDTLLKVL